MVYGTKEARQKAKKAHKGRSKKARTADESKQAKRTMTASFKNVEKWMKNPNKYDIKLVDTKRRKKKVKKKVKK